MKWLMRQAVRELLLRRAGRELINWLMRCAVREWLLCRAESGQCNG